MITELYIDNFRCLVNFRVSLSSSQLWLGDNGTGKTSVLEALLAIRKVLGGANVTEAFSADDLTLWMKSRTQTFSFKSQIKGEPYEYTLTLDYDRPERQCRIAEEKLEWNGHIFYWYDGDNAHLYRINRKTGQAEEDTQFGADWERSVISSIAKRDDNTPLIQFREAVAKWLIVHPVPLLAVQVATKETRQLAFLADNFAEWYRHVSQEDPEIGYRARDMLKEVLPGFQSLSLKEWGDSRRLTSTFRIKGKEYDIPFTRQSDGQRQLLILYVILQSLSRAHSVLLIDEPDNFVSLREIQPWLSELQSACEDHNCQSIIISHHPSIVNSMARGDELWFHRPDGGHTVTGRYPTCKGLTPAETMGRGWDDE